MKKSSPVTNLSFGLSLPADYRLSEINHPSRVFLSHNLALLVVELKMTAF